MKAPFSEKTVLITGCDTGMGKEMVKRLADMGFKVMAGCLLDETVKSWNNNNSNNNKNVFPILLDVTNQESIDRCFEEVKKQCSCTGLWGLVNNAGISELGPLEWCTVDEYKRIMDVNFFGMVAMTKFAIPLLRQAKGRIVNISSMYGRVAPPGVSHYCATKFAVEGFSDSLRRELKPFGIIVSVIEPGFIRTPMIDNVTGRLKKKFESLSDEIKKIYGGEKFIENIVEKEQLVKSNASDPAIVVEEIVHTMIAMRPKPRYVVGFDAKFLVVPISFLPTEIGDSVLEFFSA